MHFNEFTIILFIFFEKVQKIDNHIVVLVEGILQLEKLHGCSKEPNLDSAKEGGDLDESFSFKRAGYCDEI